MEMSVHVQLTLTPLYTWGPKLWYPLRMVGPHSRHGRCEEPKSLSEVEPNFLSCPFRSLLTLPTGNVCSVLEQAVS